MVDAQVEPSRRAGELPDAGGPHARVGARVVGGLDVGQRHELARHAVFLEHARDMGRPSAHPDEPLLELVRLAPLVTHLARGALQRGVADVLGPARQHTRLLLAQLLAFSAREALEHRSVVFLGLLHPPPAGARAEPVGKADLLVDHVEVLAVVDQPGPAVHLGVDPQPEADVGLELGRSRQQLRIRGERGRGDAERCDGVGQMFEHGPQTDRQRGRGT
jgi:hypothetical protein